MSGIGKMSSKPEDKLTLSLRWGSHTETVIQSLESSFGDQDFVDMTLACEGQSLQAHKVVVSACSTYLRQLLKDNPCPHPIIILKDVTMVELRRLLEFMYCGRVTVEQHQLEPLLETAKMLGIRGLASGESLTEVGDLDSRNTETSSKSESECSSQQSLKRQRSESPTSNKRPRPVPALQSILAQTLVTSSSSNRSQPQGENSDISSEVPLRSSSPSHTLAKLLAQSPSSTHGSSQSCSLETESNHAESHTSKQDDNGVINNQLVELGLQFKQEAVDLELSIDNPTEALELEYQSPDFDETVDTESYQLPVGHSSSSAYDSTASVHEHIGKATAFMLSLAKRANQNNPFGSSPSERKLSFHEPRPCPVCSKMYRDTTTLRTHMAMMHPTARLNSTNLSPNGDGGSESRLAFYEARPCSICGKMYRDAASLRTHMNIMHTMWRDGFECSCKLVFQTKHEMYQHRRSHGRLRDS